MGDVHLDRRQLDDLMGVIRREGDQLAMATGTRGGLDQAHLRGLNKVTPAPDGPDAPRVGWRGAARGLVKGESDDGGLLEVCEVLSQQFPERS